MNTMRSVLTALLVLLWLAPAAAQSTPEAAATSYMAWMKAGDWSRTATLMHPDALGELKGFFAQVAAADSSGQMLRPFGVRTPVELDALSGAEVYARMLRAVTAGNPRLLEAMRAMDTEVLGHVQEGEEVAHVLYRIRMTVNGVAINKLEVMSFRRSGDRWLALLTGDLQSMARGVTASMQRQP